MNLIFPTKIVLAVVTALSELILNPFGRWAGERLEGVLIRKDSMNGRLVEAHRREIGPFHLPVGQRTLIKACCTLVLSGGLIIAIAFADYRFERAAHVCNATSIVDTHFVSSGGSVIQRGIVNASLPSHVGALRKCVAVGRFRCKLQHGNRTYIRSVYYQAFIENGTLMCADKSTSLLRNASDVDVAYSDSLTATVSKEGDAMKLRPRIPFPVTRRVQTNFQEHEGVDIRNYFVFWNESVIFLSVNYLLLTTFVGEDLPIQVGIFPNSDKKASFYSDAGALLLIDTILHGTGNIISGSLVDVHLASNFPVQGRIEFIDSEFVQETTVRKSSIIPICLLVGGLITPWTLSMGKKSHLGTYKGLSCQYGKEMENRGQSENPQRCMSVGLISDKQGSKVYIGHIKKVL